MRIGIALPHYDFSFPRGGEATVERVSGYARKAEAAGFDSAWISDHLFLDLARYGGPDVPYRTPEALTMLAGLVAATDRIRLGTLVLCAPFRPAAVTAAAAATLHEASGARIDLGLGAGWYEREFRAAGLPFASAGRRIADLRAYAGEVRRLLDAGDLDAAPEPSGWVPPRRPRPTVWIGGKGGPKVMRAIAEQADGWNVVWRMTRDAYAERIEVLERACDAAERDPATVRRSLGLLCLIGEDRADVAARYARLQAWAPGGALDATGLEAFADGALVGTPDECAATVKEFEALGVEELVLCLSSLPFSVHDDEQLALAAETLLPLSR